MKTSQERREQIERDTAEYLAKGNVIHRYASNVFGEELGKKRTVKENRERIRQRTRKAT